MLKMPVSVILSAAKDLELADTTRFFAALRMTNWQFDEFFNSLPKLNRTILV
jgi:hypothetical protein